MSEHLWLGGGAEFDRIRAIYARLGPTGYGLGDDCALLRKIGRASCRERVCNDV